MKKKKPKAKKQPQVIYISPSESDEDEADYYEAQPPDEAAPADPFVCEFAVRVETLDPKTSPTSRCENRGV